MTMIAKYRAAALVCLVLCLCPGCRRQPATPQQQRAEASERALAQPETPAEAAMQCISIERAIDVAEMVETRDGCVAALRSADRIDGMMRSLGYDKSPVREVYQQGYAVIYTQGCQADDMGSIVHKTADRATLVVIAGKGQPQTAPLVSISMTDEAVYKQLRREMAELGFSGPGPELSNGSGYKILADEFLSGTGYIIQISRTPQP